MIKKIVEIFVILSLFVAGAYATPVKGSVENNCSHPTDTIVPQLTISSDPIAPCLENHHSSIHNLICKCTASNPQRDKRDDYEYVPGMGAHKFHARSQTFNQARKICNEEGGHLAVIDSDAEGRILVDLAKRSGTTAEQAFVGIHDLFAEGDWVTIFNDPLYKHGYNKWTTIGNQPDNAGGIEHCGTLRVKDSVGFNDVPCTIKLPFFCKIPALQNA